MYKQNIPEHARTIRNIHNGLPSGQKLFFGPTRSWGEPCGQAAFKWDTWTARRRRENFPFNVEKTSKKHEKPAAGGNFSDPHKWDTHLTGTLSPKKSPPT